jgi:hypothetical protein
MLVNLSIVYRIARVPQWDKTEAKRLLGRAAEAKQYQCSETSDIAIEWWTAGGKLTLRGAKKAQLHVKQVIITAAIFHAKNLWDQFVA